MKSSTHAYLKVLPFAHGVRGVANVDGAFHHFELFHFGLNDHLAAITELVLQ